MKPKSKKPPKLRYNIWLYFIVFALILIIVVWLMQILLFDNIYQNNKYDTLIKTGGELAQKLSDEAPPSEIIDAGINANEAGIFCYLANYAASGNEITFESIYTTFLDSDGGEAEESELLLLRDAMTKLDLSGGEYLCYRYSGESDSDYYVYATKIEIRGQRCYLILQSSQKSLVATVRVIQLQLVGVTVFVIIVAFFLSWYISTRLSRPITEIGETAKKWADGDETVVFQGDSYEELSELADAMNLAKEEISQAGLLQRDLLANVSHDLKTPLTMIKAYAEMIRDLSGEIKEKRDQHTKVIIDEADRLTMLVNDILDLSKLQNGMNQLVITQVDLSELCETVINQFSDFAKSNGYIIESEIEPELFVNCDENKIKQVFYNLIGNSINYTGKNKKILVRLVKHGDKIVFESIDSGKGISKEKIDAIWEKYYRFSETHQRPIKGTGLGLSIVKTILEAHKLKFGVISKKDVGSNFFIEFEEAQSE